MFCRPGVQRPPEVRGQFVRWDGVECVVVGAGGVERRRGGDNSEYLFPLF